MAISGSWQPGRKKLSMEISTRYWAIFGKHYMSGACKQWPGIGGRESLKFLYNIKTPQDSIPSCERVRPLHLKIRHLTYCILYKYTSK